MSVLSIATRERRVYEVAMDEVKFLQFGRNGLTSIGTANLNGCSVVMIVSAHGAILGHIPPRPEDSNSSDLEAGDRHCQMKMNEVRDLYIANRQCFPTGGSSWVLCAMFVGEVALSDQQSIMKKSLEMLGLQTSLNTYMAHMNRQYDPFSGKGTVFIDGRTGPSVYVENKQISKGNEWMTLSGPSASYSTWPSTSQSARPDPAVATATVPAKSPYILDGDITQVEKQGRRYYKFFCNEKNYETSVADWKQETVEHEGKIRPCWAYTGKNTGTKFWRWSIVGIDCGERGRKRETKVMKEVDLLRFLSMQ